MKIRNAVKILRTLALFALASVAAGPAGAELVILTDGDFFKVTAYELHGNRMRLELLSGGRVTLPMARIERIIDDEILPEPEPVEVPEEVGVLNLAFEEGQPVPETPYGPLIYRAAKRHDLNPRIVAAVVRAESAFDHRAISPKGARGLMQLMPATADRFGVRRSELFEPARNLEAGTRYLSWLLERFENDLPRALAGYNAGEGAVDRYKGVPPYRETRNYIRRIYRTLELAEEELEGIL